MKYSDIKKYDLARIRNGVLTDENDSPVSGAPVPLSGVHRMSAQQYTALAANTSMLLQIPALRPYVGFRAVYANYGAAQTIDKAKYAHAPTDLNTGGALTHSSLLFAGATSLTQGAGSGATVNEVPFIDVSDWVYEAGVARTDIIGANQLLQIRTYYSGASSQTLINSSALANFYGDGEEWAANMALASDRVTSPGAWTPSRTGTTICPVGVEFAYGVPTYTIAEVGDSLRRGQESSDANVGWLSMAHRVARAKNGSSTSGPVYVSDSWAVSGQRHEASIDTGKEVATKLRPRWLLFRAWSPNNGSPTQALMDAAWARTLDLVEHCRRLGVTPVLATTGPRNLYSAGEDALLKAQNTRVKSLAGYVPVSDEASVIEDPSNLRQILPAYNSGDGMHYTSAGYTAMAAVTAAVLR